jgi:hypothetical protein
VEESVKPRASIRSGGTPLANGHRDVTALVAVGALALLIAACGGSSSPSSPAPQPTPSPSPTATEVPAISPEETTSASPPPGLAYADLDGVVVASDLAHRLPVAIMVDDNTAARPQSGFSSASIVYQAPADGGEDRYMLVFQEGTASDIGPVRSARPYYIYWAAEYKAVFGHYGGDAQSLKQVIPAMSAAIYNMDALEGQPCPYHRISTRAMPHNAYTNTAAQISCAAKYKYPAIYQGVPVRAFADDSPLSERPASQTISIPYHTGSVSYKFDPATDSYLRSVDGHVQIDQANKQQVHARNVVVLFQTLTYDSKIQPGYNRPVLANVGSGKAIVFKEGQAIVGTWKKSSNTDLTRFYDASGNEIPLVRGRIFIQSVPTSTKVTYS